MVSFWGGLQESYEEGVLPQVCKVLQGPNDLEGGAAVKTSADLVKEKGFGWTNEELPGSYTLALAPADTPNLIISNQGL